MDAFTHDVNVITRRAMYAERNSEARGIAISITYFCVRVCARACVWEWA